MFNKDDYYFNLAVSCDAILSIDENGYNTIKNAKSSSKKDDLINEYFLSIDRNFMGYKFLKKSNYVNQCKKKLKDKYKIKSSKNLIDIVDELSMKSEYTKSYLAIEMFNFFDKSEKRFTSLENGIREYYNLIDLEIEEDIDELKEYYKKSFYILSKNRKLFNKNNTYALDIVEVIDIIKLGYISSYIKIEDVNLYFKSFGREIAERFDSWKSFYTSLILGMKLENLENDLEISEKEKEAIIRIIDEDITPYKYIKFRESPREDIKGIIDLY